MAKTLKKIAAKRESITALRAQLQEFQDDYTAARGELHALKERNAELVKWRDEARSRADSWQAEANARVVKINELERKNQGLQGTVERLGERLDMARANIERLQGWIDCKQGRDPRIETEIPF